jgi:hypothetical protein
MCSASNAKKCKIRLDRAWTIIYAFKATKDDAIRRKALDLPKLISGLKQAERLLLKAERGRRLF